MPGREHSLGDSRRRLGAHRRDLHPALGQGLRALQRRRDEPRRRAAAHQRPGGDDERPRHNRRHGGGTVPAHHAAGGVPPRGVRDRHERRARARGRGGRAFALRLFARGAGGRPGAVLAPGRNTRLLLARLYPAGARRVLGRRDRLHGLLRHGHPAPHREHRALRRRARGGDPAHACKGRSHRARRRVEPSGRPRREAPRRRDRSRAGRRAARGRRPPLRRRGAARRRPLRRAHIRRDHHGDRLHTRRRDSGHGSAGTLQRERARIHQARHRRRHKPLTRR